MDAVGTKMPLDADRLNPTDVAILDELQAGRCTPAYIAEEHGYSSGNVRNRITRLAEHGHVRPLGGGLYELVDDPRRAWVQALSDTAREFVEKCRISGQHAQIAANVDRGVERIDAIASEEDARYLKGAFLNWAVWQYEETESVKAKYVRRSVDDLLQRFGYEVDDLGAGND